MIPPGAPMPDHPGQAHHGDLLTSQSSAEGGDHETYPLRFRLSPDRPGATPDHAPLGPATRARPPCLTQSLASDSVRLSIFYLRDTPSTQSKYATLCKQGRRIE